MELVGYERDDRVALITLKRPEARNAQHAALLHELDEAWTAAAEDEEGRGAASRPLGHEAIELAREIAQMDRCALAQIKRAFNHPVDVQGQHVALQAVFDIHWLGHAHTLSRTGNRQAIIGDLATMKARSAGATDNRIQ
jgi:enoyl-CoA hydratase/carnithine racemase